MAFLSLCDGCLAFGWSNNEEKKAFELAVGCGATSIFPFPWPRAQKKPKPGKKRQGRGLSAPAPAGRLAFFEWQGMGKRRGQGKGKAGFSFLSLGERPPEASKSLQNALCCVFMGKMRNFYTRFCLFAFICLSEAFERGKNVIVATDRF